MCKLTNTNISFNAHTLNNNNYWKLVGVSTLRDSSFVRSYEISSFQVQVGLLVVDKCDGGGVLTDKMLVIPIAQLQ